MSEAAISFPILGEGISFNFKPYFTLFGWNFYWYGIIIATGFMLAVLYTLRHSRRFGLTDDNIIDLLIYAVPLAIVGARVYYILFSDWNWSGSFIDKFMRIIRLWEGGLAVYGGIIGGFAGALIYSRVRKIKFGALADIGALGLLIGQAVGRWGNFTNREAYGAKTDVAWKMGLTNQYGTFYYHPCFLYESLWNVLGLVLLHFYSKRRKYDGEVFILYIGWYGIGRAMIEPLRQDSLMLYGSELRVSLLVAVLCVFAAIGMFIYNRVIRYHDMDELWVNRINNDISAEDIIENENIEPAKEEGETEELPDLLKILRKTGNYTGDDADTIDAEDAGINTESTSVIWSDDTVGQSEAEKPSEG